MSFLVSPIRYVVGSMIAGALALTLTAAALPAVAAPSLSALGGGTPSPSPTPMCAAAWTAVSAPGDGTLLGSAAVSATDVWAVGSTSSGSTTQPLTQHWNGQAWSVVPNPPVPGFGRLQAVAAAPAGDLWAVGFTDTVSRAHTLVEHWDGQNWNVIPSANTSHDYNQLNAVAVIGENDVWAVGVLGEENETIIEHWDGSSWSLVPPPVPPPGRTYLLNAVAGSATDDVWAAGVNTDFNNSQTLLLHWAGQSWSVVPSPSPGTQHNTLKGMVALAADDAWVVGDYWMAGSGNPYLALAEHWDGTAWTVVPMPNIGTNINALNAVTAIAAHDLWAVGNYRSNFGPYWPLALHWDGSTWTAAAPPNPPTQHNTLYAAGAVGPQALWAVGDQGDTSIQPLVEQYSALCATPSPSASATPPPATATATPAQATLTTTTTATAVQATLTAVLPTHTIVPTASATPLPNATQTPALTPLTVTPTPASTVTVCAIHFSDVTDTTAYYYQAVYYLACRGVISGYSDGTFKPFLDTTRGQMTKIVTLAFNRTLVTPPVNGTFADVDGGSVFYGLIETAAARGIVSGYSCGGVNPQTGAAEPCDGTRRPYFRPNNPVTRGQLAKIVTIGAGWPLHTPTTPTFSDVATGNVFYPFIETALCHGTVGGYSDGTFRPNSYALRGQIAKIVYLAVTNTAVCSGSGAAGR